MTVADPAVVLTALKSSGVLSQEALANLNIWLTREDLAEFRGDIYALIKVEDYQQLEDIFYTRIRVGTGGIRGRMGVGSNRINRRTIAEAAAALAEFIGDFGVAAKDKGVVIGYEARARAREFAEMCAEVFAANGIKSFIFDGLRATPEISFAVRFLGATAGVQITASHNPRTDNGFKFYWSDGGQVVPPMDLRFMELVGKVNKIEYLPFAEGVAKNLIGYIGAEVDEAYRQAVLGLSLASSRSAQVVFSPIHGAGITNVLPVLNRAGFMVEVVPETAEPDANFPTARGDLINPEYEEVMELPIKLAEKLNYDLAITSDPDADRIGVAVREKMNENRLRFLSGDEVGIALTHFILVKKLEKGELTPRHVLAETYVTTSLIGDIARRFGITVIDDLPVGFKFIGEVIEKLRDKNDFVFGVEQSLGYLVGTFVRDKDAAIAALLLAELVSECKDQGRTLIDYLDEIYLNYGYYKNNLRMVECPGKIGFQNIRAIMLGLRQHPPMELGGVKILKVIDRLPEAGMTAENYKPGAANDQLTFIFSEDEKTRVTIRPSGTEPKIKFYAQDRGVVAEDLEKTRASVDDRASGLLEAVVAYGDQFVRLD
ncbi:MAG: phospho-sugar mutase [Patescibacteria group bacterium]